MNIKQPSFLLNGKAQS